MMTSVARRAYTDAEKAEALALYEELGPREAAARLDIPSSTIASWATVANVRTRSTETKGAAVQASVLTMQERKAQLAVALMDDIERLRQQMWAPVVEKKVVTLSGGQGMPGTWDVAEVELTQPTFGDQKSIMTSLAIAVDKVQILTGDVTSRTETIGPEREQVKERLAELIDLQARRAS